MKKYLFITLILIATACKRNATSNAEISNLPEFNFMLIDSATIVSSDKIAGGTKLFIMYFRPDCEHCQLETRNIIKNLNQINSKILLLTPAPFGELKTFYKDFDLASYQRIMIGSDYDYSFLKKFKPKGVPYMAIYDSGKKLKKLYVGETDFQLVLKEIKS